LEHILTNISSCLKKTMIMPSFLLTRVMARSHYMLHLNAYKLSIKFNRSYKNILPCWSRRRDFITSEVPLSRKTPFSRLSAGYNKAKGHHKEVQMRIMINIQNNWLPESIQKLAILGSKFPTSTVSPTAQ
jgi:hypothetical protein